MAIEIFVRKLHHTIIPVDDAQAELFEEIKPNAVYKAVFTQPRNLPYHRKFYALLNVAFEAWDAPAIEHKGRAIEKNFERFRKDIIILCGFYETVFNIKGDLRLEAKSISFAKMDHDEFQSLYSKAIDIILRDILTNYTRDNLDEQVNRVLGFC